MKYLKIVCFYTILSFIVTNAVVAQNNIIHVVEQGDTVYNISKRYGITQEQLLDLNPWAKDALKIGGKLLLPGGSKKNMSNNKTYVIKNGDTMYSVCKKYGVTEEQLIAANTGLSATKFPSGRGIVIPNKGTSKSVDKDTTKLEAKKTKEEPQKVSLDKDNFIKITLALPFVKSSKYVEYYKGFLMGLNEEKQKGISIDLNVVDLSSYSSNDESFSNRDIVIGGVSYQDVLNIKNKVNKGYYVVPFSGDNNIMELSKNIIQINNPDSYTDEIAVQAFLSEYGNKNVYFADDYATQESQFSRLLKIKLTDQNKRYKILDLTGNVSDIEKNSVIVPIAKDERLLNGIFGKIQCSDNFEIFGYPLWQSFNKELTNQMHKYKTRIYTTFYFDAQKANSEIFANKFRAWYGHKLSNSYPQFGVMGYDMARYFIESYHKNKNVLGPLSGFEPLQMNINVEKTSKGYVNHSLYFISFNRDGSITKTTL